MVRDLLVSKFRGDKVPREAPPPSRWGMSRTGNSKFVIRKVGYRNARGQKLYRLGFFIGDGKPPLFSNELWTLDKLNINGVVWLQESPFAAGTNENPTDRTPDLPAGAEVDSEPETEPAPEPKPEAAPITAVPTMFEERYGFGVGDVRVHDSGKLYKVLAIIDADTVRVEQVLPDGKKTPGRNMRGTKLNKPVEDSKV